MLPPSDDLCGELSSGNSGSEILVFHYLDTMGRVSFFVSLLSIASYTVAAPWAGEKRTENGVDYQCKCYSDNACWPTNMEWEQFNKTVEYTLQRAIPPGAVCHTTYGNSSSVYDAAKCAEVRANFLKEQYQ